MALTWHVDVDWNNDGTLEADEAARLLGVNLTRGREHLLNANGNGFEPTRAGECTLTRSGGTAVRICETLKTLTSRRLYR